MGVDTVKLSYRVEPRIVLELLQRDGWEFDGDAGTVGLTWWTTRVHPEGLRVTIKGCGRQAYLLWEASVPKTLGLAGPAEPEDVILIHRWLRRLTPSVHLPAPAVRRCDLTHDEFDPEGVWLEAAIGWKPHDRARYVQGRYQDDETVWLHNKSRGVRVYDKHIEQKKEARKSVASWNRKHPGERVVLDETYRVCEWARGITRVEYQVGRDWCEKYGLDRLLALDWPRRCREILEPVVADLRERAALVAAGRPMPGPPWLQQDGLCRGRPGCSRTAHADERSAGVV